jgi:hypothetical protein
VALGVLRSDVLLRAWFGACALIAGGSLLAAAVPGSHETTGGLLHFLAWDPSRWMTRPWTLWTAAWVSTSDGSLGANLLAFAILSVLGGALGAGRAAAVALLVAWPLGTLALLVWPQVTQYTGLGEPVHATAMVLAASLAGRGALKPLAPLAVAAMGLKLVAERAWAQPVAFDPSWGSNVVYAAHLTGAIAGALCGFAARVLERPAPR